MAYRTYAHKTVVIEESHVVTLGRLRRVLAKLIKHADPSARIEIIEEVEGGWPHTKITASWNEYI